MSYKSKKYTINTILVTILLGLGSFLFFSGVNLVHITPQEEYNSEVAKLEKQSNDIDFKNVTEGMSSQQKLDDNFFVFDEHNYLSDEMKINLYDLNKNMIEQLDTSPQLVFYLVDTLNGKDIDQFKVEKGRELGVGGKEDNSGLLFVFAFEDRKFALATGYGMEEIIPDAMKDTIVNDDIKSSLTNKKYDEAVEGVATNITNILLASPIGYNLGELNDYKEKVKSEKSTDFTAKSITFIFASVLGYLMIYINGLFFNSKIRRAEDRKKLELVAQDYPNYDKEIVDEIITSIVKANIIKRKESVETLFVKEYQKTFNTKFYDNNSNYLPIYSDKLLPQYIENLEYQQSFIETDIDYKNKITNLDTKFHSILDKVYPNILEQIDKGTVQFHMNQLSISYEDLVEHILIKYMFGNFGLNNILDSNINELINYNEQQLLNTLRKKVKSLYLEEVQGILEEAHYPYISVITQKELSGKELETELKDIKELIKNNNNHYVELSRLHRNDFKKELQTSIQNNLFASEEFVEYFNNFNFNKHFDIYLLNDKNTFKKEYDNIGNRFYNEVISEFTDGKYRKNKYIESFDEYIRENLTYEEFKKRTYKSNMFELENYETQYKERYDRERRTGNSYDASGVLIYSDPSHSYNSTSSSSSSSSGGGGDFGGGGFSGGW